MPSYLTLAEFKARSVVPSVAVDELEAMAPGFVLARLTIESAWIDSRLAKRYAAPFATPVPDVILGWVAAIVSEQVYRRRGVDPNDPQAEQYVEDATRARNEVLEAANAETGLFLLPLRQDTPESGVSKGECLGYSEASPWVAFDKQARRGREEDAAGDGTGG